jgi:hypothetical protein
VAVAALATAYTILVASPDGGLVPLGMVTCLLCACPVSPFLAPRICVAGLLALGWTPLTYFLPWPSPVDHGAALVACGIGGLAGWVFHGPNVRVRLSGLLPRIHAVDALPLVSALVSIFALRRWLTAGTAQQALSILLSGYDNSSHVSMFVLVRHRERMLDLSGTGPDGAPWYFANYPTGFHGVAAATADLLGFSSTAGPEQTVAYLRSVSFIVVLCVVVLTASLCSVPRLRERPASLVPSASFATCAFVLGPGATTLADGFAPFWYAVALVSALLISFAWLPSLSPIVYAAVVGGVAVGVANSWAPLTIFVAPVVIALLWASRARGRGGFVYEPGKRKALALVVLLALVGTVRPAFILMTTVSPRVVAEASGGFSPPAPIPLIVLLSLTLLLFQRYVRPRAALGVPASGTDIWWAPLALVAVLGLVAALALIVAQLLTRGSLGYYFFKYVTGFELILVGLLSLLAAVRLAALSSRLRLTVALVALPLAIGLAVVLQPARDAGWSALTSESRVGTGAFTSGAERRLVTRGIVDATAGADPVRNRRILLIAPASDQHAFLTQAWFMALTGSWTTRGDDIARTLAQPILTPNDAVRVARSLLMTDPTITMLVPQSELTALRSGLAQSGLAGRIQPTRGSAHSARSGEGTGQKT